MKRVLTPKKTQQTNISDKKLFYMMNSLFLGQFKSNMITKNHSTIQPFIMSNSAKLNSPQKNQKKTIFQVTKRTHKNTSSSLSKISQTRQKKIFPNTQKDTLRPRSSFATRASFKSKLNRSQDKIQSNFMMVQTTPQTPIQPLLKKIQKSMCSSKVSGMIKAYGVNSHKFYMNPYMPSQARICIISNLTKTTNKERIISYFSLIQGTRSPVYLDFAREYFHIILSQSLSEFPLKPISEQFIEKCIKKMEKKFCQVQGIPLKKSNCLSSQFQISYAMIFTYKSNIYIVTKGVVKVCISQCLGQKRREFSSHKLKVTELSYSKDFDHIVIASEGINTSKKIQILSQYMWKIFMKALSFQQNRCNSKISLHEMIGLNVDTLMDSLSNLSSSKNMSIIFMAFQNMESILNPVKDEIELPYICADSKIS